MENVVEPAGAVGEGQDELNPKQRGDVLRTLPNGVVIDHDNKVSITVAVPIQEPDAIEVQASTFAVYNRHEILRYSWAVDLKPARSRTIPFVRAASRP